MALASSCHRESTALHCDYYSTTLQTATPLNEKYTRAPISRAKNRKRIRVIAQYKMQFAFRFCFARTKIQIAKTAMK
jgi:hypothetical protein